MFQKKQARRLTGKHVAVETESWTSAASPRHPTWHVSSSSNCEVLDLMKRTMDLIGAERGLVWVATLVWTIVEIAILRFVPVEAGQGERHIDFKLGVGC